MAIGKLVSVELFHRSVRIPADARGWPACLRNVSAGEAMLCGGGFGLLATTTDYGLCS